MEMRKGPSNSSIDRELLPMCGALTKYAINDKSRSGAQFY